MWLCKTKEKTLPIPLSNPVLETLDILRPPPLFELKHHNFDLNLHHDQSTSHKDLLAGWVNFSDWESITWGGYLILPRISLDFVCTLLPISSLRISSHQLPFSCVDGGSFVEPVWDSGLLQMWIAVGEGRDADYVPVFIWHLGDPYFHHCSKAGFWYCEGDFALASAGRGKICCGPPLTSYRLFIEGRGPPYLILCTPYFSNDYSYYNPVISCLISAEYWWLGSFAVCGLQIVFEMNLMNLLVYLPLCFNYFILILYLLILNELLAEVLYLTSCEQVLPDWDKIPRTDENTYDLKLAFSSCEPLRLSVSYMLLLIHLLKVFHNSLESNHVDFMCYFISQTKNSYNGEYHQPASFYGVLTP